jgi:hypothetical protein
MPEFPDADQLGDLFQLGTAVGPVERMGTGWGDTTSATRAASSHLSGARGAALAGASDEDRVAAFTRIFDVGRAHAVCRR